MSKLSDLTRIKELVEERSDIQQRLRAMEKALLVSFVLQTGEGLQRENHEFKMSESGPTTFRRYRVSEALQEVIQAAIRGEFVSDLAQVEKELTELGVDINA